MIMEKENQNPYKTFELISTLFAIVFCLGMFVKFLFD